MNTNTLFFSSQDAITLTRFILSGQQKHPASAGDLSLILAAIATACKAISSAVRRAGLIGLYGVDGATNATGDVVKRLDVLSDEIFCNSLRHTKRVALMVSEEQETAIVVPDARDAKYIVSFDPLDGSSNIDCNVSVGSIFGIARRAPAAVGSVATPEEALQPGTSLTAAGYCVYGSSTQLVLAFQGEEVNVFTLCVDEQALLRPFPLRSRLQRPPTHPLTRTHTHNISAAATLLLASLSCLKPRCASPPRRSASTL